MAAITLTFPPEIKVIGVLQDRSDLEALDQDLLQLELPGRLFIHVGWYPDWTESGSYRLSVFQDDGDNELEEVFKTKDTLKVTNQIYKIVKKYTRGSKPCYQCSGRMYPHYMINYTTKVHKVPVVVPMAESWACDKCDGKTFEAKEIKRWREFLPK